MMKRDLSALAGKHFDLLVVGGGIFGAFAAWDATLRGLSVALVEATDFCAGVSANSFKMVHGGIRYLQHADLVRLRSSCRERSALLRIAPHLVQPLPIVIPTYGHGRSGKEFLGAGMLLYDLLTLDRNHAISDTARRIPWTRFFGREELLSHFPDLDPAGLTGGAMFHDGQMYNPTRLVLAVLQSAIAEGAQVVNYTEALSFLRDKNRIEGVKVRDTLTGETFDIRSHVVLNAAGPWAERLLADAEDVRLQPQGIYSRDACFVVPRKLAGRYALAVQGRTSDPDALMGRPARHLFIVPWRDYSLIGVWHVVYDQHPSDVTVTTDQLQSFIDEVNWAHPPLQLTLDEVRIWNAGLVPFGENESGAENLSYGKRSHLVDHADTHGVDGLVTLVGIRFTMARGDAARAIDLAASKIGRGGSSQPSTDMIPVHGGDIEDFERLVLEILCQDMPGIDERVARALAHNHGTEYPVILGYAKAEPALSGTIGESTVLRAEVANAIDNEMAHTLPDIVFRRTDLATAGDPGFTALYECAAIAAARLSWDTVRLQKEVISVTAQFPAHHQRGPQVEVDALATARRQ